MIAGPPENVVPTVVPGNSGLIPIDRPGAVGRSMAFSRLAAFLQRYGERLAGDSQTNLPFPDKIGGGR